MIQTTIKIDGMMCNMCAIHVSEAIRRKFDIKKVKASHSKGEATIISDDVLDEAELCSAVTENGYDVLSVTTEEYKKKGLFGR